MKPETSLVTLPSTAVAAALDPPPPVRAIVGGDVYPIPVLVMVMELTASAVRTAVPAALAPPPPLKLTVGGDV